MLSNFRLSYKKNRRINALSALKERTNTPLIMSPL